MADPAAPANGQDALNETLSRLSKKSGVKATIALDRATGAILRTSGQLSSFDSAAALNASALPSQGSSFSGDVNSGPNDESQGLQDFAAKVWAFVNLSGNLIQDLDTEDELKLLRLRTKKQELIIVPDAKYLLITVHDTPPA